MAVVTDLAEVFRLGTAKAEENRDFRRYLAARHSSERPFQLRAAEVQRAVDCTACANCCRRSIVSLGLKEIEAIAKFLGVDADSVRRLYTDPDPDAPAARVLRGTDEGCVFLYDNLCLIYEARPKACREFPHIRLGDHSLGSRPASMARWAALCPILYNALETYKHVTGFHHRRTARAASGQS